jgi:membrane-bound lytic murein transglycosylase D
MRPDLTTARLLWALPLLLQILLLVGCASQSEQREVAEEQPRDYGDSSTFPIPPEIRDNVDFWRHVYGTWSRGQVAIHDDEHLGVIYEVSRIPGPIQASYSSSQKAWLDSRTEYYASRLKDLEDRVRMGQTLTSNDKELMGKFDKAGGSGGIYGASERVRAQRGLRERFKRGLEISGRYDQTFREVMRRHGVPEDLAYLPHVESSFQTNARSGVGASGVWQFMPATGRLYMTVDSAIDERNDPILAANGAARYLAQAHSKLGSWPLAITSYNHGQGGMANAKSQHGRDIGNIVRNYKGQYFGFASRNFYSEFLAAREVASNSQRYFPEGVHYEQPWQYDRLVLRSNMPAEHVADHYGVSSERLADINLHWRDSVRSGNTFLPAGSTVWLPSGSLRRVASQPPPVPMQIAIAKTTPKQEIRPIVAESSYQAKGKADIKLTKAWAKPTLKYVSRLEQSNKTQRVRYHVVKPQETLYRVAVLNGLSVAELRRLNKMKPQDNQILPGQRLKVGI